MSANENCELCAGPGGELVWQDDRCRVVRVGGREGADYPGFCRVVWQRHAREMTDLTASERSHLMRVVFAVEGVLRECCQPDKINLASLGNLTPHVHWHVIPRWRDDRRFPAPIWATARDDEPPIAAARPPVGVETLRARLLAALATA